MPIVSRGFVVAWFMVPCLSLQRWKLERWARMGGGTQARSRLLSLTNLRVFAFPVNVEGLARTSHSRANRQATPTSARL